MRKIGRNEKCGCGSGTKYKNCCLKKQPPVLSSIGFFYKSKDDDGFCLSVSDYLNPDLFEFFVEVFNHIKKEWEIQKNDMSSPFYTTSFEENMNSTIELEITTLKEEISNWYKINGFTDGLQPLSLPYVDWKVSHRTKPTLVKILRSIYILTEVGVIKNDNYNGLILSYSLGEKLKKVS